MSASHRPLENPATAYGETLRALGGEDPLLRVVTVPLLSERLVGAFRMSFSDRVREEPLERALASAGEMCGRGHRVVLPLSPERLFGSELGRLREVLSTEPRPLHIVSEGGFTGEAQAVSAGLDDLAILRGMPHLNVVAPADAPSTGAALRAVMAGASPSYLRLPSVEPIASVTEGRFELGRAQELRPGDDLTLGAVGPLVEVALDTAEELGRVGVGARVLDFASVKPFDTSAVLRAARDTGAILTLEEHQAANGVGALVAAITAENYPVPVRRLGVPDLVAPPGAGREAAQTQLGLTVSRALEEAWELLRMKGKVQ